MNVCSFLLQRAMADAETEATARYEELETEMQHAKVRSDDE